MAEPIEERPLRTWCGREPMRDPIWILRDASGQVVGASAKTHRAALEDALLASGSGTWGSLQSLGRMIHADRTGTRFACDGYTLQREEFSRG